MTRLLLCGVFKPYGVQDDTGEALCSMELLNNQITREQGIHSPRSNNPSFGLYLMAENLHVPVTVLDFPSWKEFTREIDTGCYTHVGISFIVPNAVKARQMAEYVRARSPQTKILLGGHGVAIPDIRGMIPCDDVCTGEGVAWLREYFGEETGRSIVHPVLPSSINAYVYGAHLQGKAGIIIPGVGCQNSCRFCSTSHKFDRKYTPFLRTGRDIFDACSKCEDKLGAVDFGVLDENFCKEAQRARELLVEMEKNGKAYSFSIFSSAEAIRELGTDFLVRAGVNFIWIGVESKAGLFEKTHGIDLHEMIADLQAHGISILASSILFLEHHDKATIHEDIEWAISLKSDLSQFMGLGPMPGTRLYMEYEAAGKLLNEIPWQKKHGQDEIWFRHPEFTLPETARYVRDAFVKKYEDHGPAVLNMARTAIQGYLRVKSEIEERENKGLRWDPESLRYVPAATTPVRDNFMLLRLECMRRTALQFRPILGVMLKYAPNVKAIKECRKVMALYIKVFGTMTLTERMKSGAVQLLAIRERHIMRRDGGTIMRQPPTNRVSYPDRRLD